MKSYTNMGGDSGIIGYEVGADSIIVEFSDGSRYEYTYESAGRSEVEFMKVLAKQGEGLNGYISRNCPGYSRKF